MIRLCKKEKVFGMLIRLVYRVSTKEQFFEKLSKKQYLEILGINDKDQMNFRGKDLHRAYLNQIKKYHSDKVHTEEAKRQFDEITKCITKAYEQLKNQEDSIFYSNKPNAQTFYEQEQVARDLFGKSYVDIKHSLYASGNQQMRAKFVEELLKRKKINPHQTYSQTSKSYQARSTGFSQNSYQSPTVDHSKAIATTLGVICLALVPFLLMQSKKKAVLDKQNGGLDNTKHKVRDYSQQQYDIIHENTKKLAIKPYQRFCNLILKRRPHMLNYPSNFDLDIFQQLTNHSIAPDIHLFQVNPKYFVNKDAYKKLLEENTVEGIEKYELTETKPNTLMTLSLEAERMLHNIYIPVDDVLQEIKEKGKYTPPKVFFRFYGFIMFEIRDKPLSNLIGYRNSRYISLFDLYFDYYSAIFFKRNYYAQYLVGFQKDEALKYSRYFGNVNLNHREVPTRYLEKGQKVVVMKDVEKAYESSGKLKQFESKYAQDWQNYYARFEKNWKKYCVHQINSQH